MLFTIYVIFYFSFSFFLNHILRLFLFYVYSVFSARMYVHMYVCMYVYHMCAWYLRKPEEGVGSLGTGVTGSFEPPCCCWELNPGPLLVLLSTKPSVQPPRFLLTQKGDLLKVNLLLMTPFSIRPMFYTLHLRKLDQGVTPSNSPLRQADAGIGEFMMSQLPLDCRLQDLSEVNTESNAVDKTLQMA